MLTAPSTREARAAAPSASLSTERLFRDLVTSHREPLQAFVQRHIGHAADAEDLTQQAFAEAARSLATFRGEAALSTWLYGIAMNLVRNHLSRAPHRRQRIEGDDALDALECTSPGPERQVENSQVATLLLSELAALSPEMRDVLLLVAVDDLSYEDAALMLSIPIGTVRSRVSRARGVLRERFRAAGIDTPL